MAEAGRSSGAQIDIITKSGTNQLRGSISEYYRPTNTVANRTGVKFTAEAYNVTNTPRFEVAPGGLSSFTGGRIGGHLYSDTFLPRLSPDAIRTASRLLNRLG
jgi:hypothetical protein